MGGTSDPWQVRRADGTVAAGWYLLPLRLFLGATFLFAGLQKLANPDFFRNASPISIHAQLAGAARTSPIHGLLSHLVSVSPAIGLLIAVSEVAIGIGALVGLLTRVAAAGGVALSLGLFLAVSFHSRPYYTGADIVFLFAWTPLLLAGAAGAPAIDTWLAGRRALQPAAGQPGPRGGRGAVSRRAVVSTGVVAGVVAGATVLIAGIAAGIGRALSPTSASGNGGPSLGGGGGGATSTSAPTGTSTTAGQGSTSSSAPAAPLPKGTNLGSASVVPVGGSASFTDPASGDPAIVIQQTSGQFVAFDAICPHAGCTVGYQPSAKIIVCPCHGSEFNSRTGAVETGPASSGLTSIKITEGPNGDLYVPS
jgi:thiosulfate dehydrogenase (quinone) large subunit